MKLYSFTTLFNRIVKLYCLTKKFDNIVNIDNQP
jgi:hypothetical protein